MGFVRGVSFILLMDDALGVVLILKNRRSIIFLNSFGSIDQIGY
jgi:hypothetical protein